MLSRLQLAVLAYNLGNLWRRLALPQRIKSWSLTSLQRRLMKTGDRAAFSDRNRSERGIDRETRTKALHPSRRLEYPHRVGMAKREILVYRRVKA